MSARPTRRRLLQGLGSLGAVAAAGGLAGCAGAPAVRAAGAPSLGRVVVVGGGFGGATAAHYLKRWGGHLDVTLVDRNAAFVSCPMSNLVLAGYRAMADITLSYAGLQALGVNLVQAEVQALDVEARQVRLAGDQRLPYDRLVVAPGIDFMPEQVDGLAAAFASQRALHAWKAGPQTLALRAQLQALPEGGVVVISVPKVPYRCPPGPYERACLVASYLQQHKPRAKLLLLDANPEVQSKKALFERAFAQLYPGLLEYRPNSEVKGVQVGLVQTEFESVRADVLNVIPPQRAADLALRAGLANVNQRWAGVSWLGMESTAVPGVHVIGDAVFGAALMPKSAHMANQQAKLAAAAVIQQLRGEPLNAQPVLMNTCYSFVNAREAIHVASVHQYDAGEKTFKPVPGAGGVSAAASEAEGRYAQAWAQNIWGDTLA